MKTDQQYKDSIKIGCFSGMAFIILILSLMMSCTSQPLTKSFRFQAAYAPSYQCEGLDPETVELTIDGKLYILEILESKNGIMTKEMEMPYGRYMITKAVAKNKEGEITHWIASEFDKDGWVVINTNKGKGFPIEVNDGFDWISGQMFCDGKYR